MGKFANELEAEIAASKEKLRKAVSCYELALQFIRYHKISCPEATIEDRVVLNAPDLVEELANVVGYYKYEDDEE